jgi:hypothetical protein
MDVRWRKGGCQGVCAPLSVPFPPRIWRIGGDGVLVKAPYSAVPLARDLGFILKMGFRSINGVNARVTRGSGGEEVRERARCGQTDAGTPPAAAPARAKILPNEREYSIVDPRLAPAPGSTHCSGAPAPLRTHLPLPRSLKLGPPAGPVLPTPIDQVGETEPLSSAANCPQRSARLGLEEGSGSSSPGAPR